MDDLLRHYERELTLLRQSARAFAERYPKVASRLPLTNGADGGSDDPSVERLFQSFALIAARASQNIENDYPEFTTGLVEALYPHYLRPFPSCSIACFEVDSSRAAQMSTSVVIARGTQLYSPPVRGVKVFFRTAFDVTLSPLQVSGARFQGIAQAPQSLRLPPNAGAQISISFAIQSAHACVADLKLDSIRLYAQGEPLFSAALRDALSIHALCAYVEPAHTGRWIALDRVPFSALGMARDESLMPWPETVDTAYALLTEFFAFPEKFGFFDCDLRQAGRLGGRAFTLHLLLKDIPADSEAARLLESLGPQHLVPGCTPVVNLFEARGKLGKRLSASSVADAYPLLVDEQNAHAYEVYSVDSVSQVSETPQGEKVTEYPALHSLLHDPRATLYWRTHRDALMARSQPGHELALGFVDERIEPVSPPNGLGFKLTCTNRDLPEQLAHGAAAGDLLIEGGTLARRIALLQRPTRPLYFRHDRGALWRLISQLSLNPHLLNAGPEPMRDLLRLHDMTGSPVSARQVEGVVDVAERAVMAWVAAKPIARVVRGLEIRVTVNESHFAETGLNVFAQLLDALLSVHVASNGFTELVLLSSSDGTELLRCPRRSGRGHLI
ncbi:type VI secretion system baseplate subunit TssF [Paraburkholderia silviterrae]|uniref:Type VI secretion system baseplate subunit TssF n=1 Tax=Paraburkholderia silviterrae TaxID=2528715 RepID=A0A4R5LXQ3_9BURK|nr:type VI secretion system baseplate subunit TssF [Paraburkholderia silviterrae]TDG16945.1 type VI secretion system baseplate subunit TssF [Paraburkholderia silviterrae]